MTLKSQLESALKDAMRSGDDLRKRTLRMALSNIRLVEVDKGAALDDQGVMAILQKEIKSRHESIADAQRANRPGLIAEAQAEIEVLEGYLPKALSAEELEQLARQAVAEVGATSPREMGQVMKVLMPRLQGKATGEQASQAVRKLLQ
ncbi:MAG: GatB/YqeY domain-containing protein [Anaerolineales bacterium]|nr:GatB/YqeY domain-containing protein [Anaerolineales bacterium]